MIIHRHVGASLVYVVFGLLQVPPTEAQQVCYAYDATGRLTGVIDENSNAALYQYDAVGNMLSIRRPSATGRVTIYTISASSGAPGEQVEIFGVGFSAIANQNQVTIGGVPTSVVSTLPCTLVVEVPPDGISGQIHVTTPFGEATSDDRFLVSRFAIAGTAFAVLPNTSVQYTVVSNGCNDPAVAWRVNGTVGGNPAVGTITTSGLYTSPANIPTPAFVIVGAASIACPTLSDEKPLNIVRDSTTFIFAAASASHGVQPPSFPPQAVMASVSARYGLPAVILPANTVLASASAANVPVITALVPNSRNRPSTFVITITGIDLTGATGLTFFGAATPDAAITVSSVAVNPDGTSLTANISIASTATTGTRTIRVDRPDGNSTAVRTSGNVFTVAP
jgi:YD repeat-containing protein